MPFPIGLILIWSGAIIDIPAGYALCNGANGTPDLRNKFIVGAGDTYAVDDEGGNTVHDHDFTGTGHTHTLPAGAQIEDGTGFSQTTQSTAVTGTTAAVSSLPPYYSLAYIMKI